MLESFDYFVIPEIILDYIGRARNNPYAELIIPNTLPYDTLFRLVQSNSMLLTLINNPPEKLLIDSLLKYPNLIQEIKKEYMTPTVCKGLLSVTPSLIAKMKQTEELCVYALMRGDVRISIRITSEAIEQAKKIWYTGFEKLVASDEWVTSAAEINPGIVCHVVNPPHTVVMKAISRWPDIAVVMSDTPRELIEYALSLDSKILRYANQDEDLCWLALKMSSMNISLINKPTDDMNDYSLEDSVDNIMYINNPSFKQCLKAFEKQPQTIIFMKPEDITEELAINAYERCCDLSSYPGRYNMQINGPYFNSKAMMAMCKLIPPEMRLKSAREGGVWDYRCMYDAPLDIYQTFIETRIESYQSLSYDDQTFNRERFLDYKRLAKKLDYCGYYDILSEIATRHIDMEEFIAEECPDAYSTLYEESEQMDNEDLSVMEMIKIHGPTIVTTLPRATFDDIEYAIRLYLEEKMI